MLRFWYFAIALSIVSFMLATFTWMSFPVTSDEKYIERYTKSDSEDLADKHNLHTYFLDLEHGEATLFITPEGKVILIDVGNAKSFSKLQFILSDLKISKIDYVFLTTNDIDHVGAFPFLVESYPIKHVYIPFSDEDNYFSNEIAKALQQTKNMMLKANKIIEIEKDLKIQSLYSNPTVLHIKYKQVSSVLMMSDANYDIEEHLIDNYSDLIKAQILKVGNHGQRLTCTDEFLEIVNPQVAIILGGDVEENSRPSYGVIERLTESWIEVYRNDAKGSVKITFDGEQYEIEASINGY